MWIELEHDERKYSVLRRPVTVEHPTSLQGFVEVDLTVVILPLRHLNEHGRKRIFGDDNGHTPSTSS